MISQSAFTHQRTTYSTFQGRAGEHAQRWAELPVRAAGGHRQDHDGPQRQRSGVLRAGCHDATGMELSGPCYPPVPPANFRVVEYVDVKVVLDAFFVVTERIRFKRERIKLVLESETSSESKLCHIWDLNLMCCG